MSTTVKYKGATIATADNSTVTLSTASTWLEDNITITDESGGGGTPYEGPYEVTPTRETQTLATSGMSMSANVTVNPIPSNYGLITWDGAKLTIS